MQCLLGLRAFLAVGMVALSLCPCADAVTFDPNIGDKVTKQPVTGFSSKDGGFDGQVFVMALHEQHPFVFFDCDSATAREEWDKEHTENPKATEPVPDDPIAPPATCKRQNECPDAPDSEPFCGITVDLAKEICAILNCTVKFHIASKNPHHWESSSEAVRAIGAGQRPGEKHWADVAGGAIHMTEERAHMVHFTSPYFQTGYRMITRRPKKVIDMWSFFRPFSLEMWLVLVGEMVVVALLLYLMESPTITLAEDSDLIDEAVPGLLDAFYWSFTTFTTYLDKAPRTAGGKLVMSSHGFFILIILASYTANLASFLTTATISPPFSGWDTGSSPVVPDVLKTVNLAVPSASSQDVFLLHEEEKWTESKGTPYKFDNLHKFDSFEEAVDSVLCGKDEAAFHDESMLLYYLNHEMVKFGQGTYTTGVCDASKLQLPARSKRCGLMFAGDLFHAIGYGYAFGADSTAFIPWSQAILRLTETKAVAKLVANDNYKIAATGLNMLAADCDSGSNESEFEPQEFLGLLVLCGVVAGVGLLQNVAARLMRNRREKTAIAPMEEAVIPDGQGKSDGALDIDPTVEAAIKVCL